MRGIPPQYAELLLHQGRAHADCPTWPAAPYSVLMEDDGLPKEPIIRRATTRALLPCASLWLGGVLTAASKELLRDNVAAIQVVYDWVD